VFEHNAGLLAGKLRSRSETWLGHVRPVLYAPRISLNGAKEDAKR